MAYYLRPRKANPPTPSRTIMGHWSAIITEVYAELDQQKAMEVVVGGEEVQPDAYSINFASRNTQPHINLSRKYCTDSIYKLVKCTIF